MKTVKITIEVEVSEWATHVAVDGNGSIYEYGCEPKECDYSPCWDTNCKNAMQRCFNDIEDVINWRETLTKVN
jgi:hypothetical protein